MQGVKDFEKEITLRWLTIIFGEVISYIWPIENLWIDILDRETWPMRDSLGWNLFLFEDLLLSIKYFLKIYQLAFVCTRQEIATFKL